MKMHKTLLFILFSLILIEPLQGDIYNYYNGMHEDPGCKHRENFKLRRDCDFSQCEFSKFGYIKGGYKFGEGIGIRHSYGTLGLVFAPLIPRDDYYPFLDLKGHYVKDGLWGANIGCGLRWRDCMTGFIFGSNFYYDYRKTHISNLHQVGFGLEFFTNCFELRGNAYFPVGNNHHHRFYYFNEYSGDYFVNCFQTEIAQKGFDVELGHIFWTCRSLSVYAGIAGYYFTDTKRESHHRKRWGEKARVSFNWGTLINLQAIYYHDPIQDSFGQGIVTINIPTDFCFAANLWEKCLKAFTQPVERNDLIVKRKFCDWDCNYSY